MSVMSRRVRPRGLHRVDLLKHIPRPPPPGMYAQQRKRKRRRKLRGLLRGGALRKQRHRDILGKDVGDITLWTKSDHNFYTTTGFVGVVFNPNDPMLRFVVSDAATYVHAQIGWTGEDAIVVRALHEISSWAALHKVTQVLANRLMILDEKVRLVLPESEAMMQIIEEKRQKRLSENRPYRSKHIRAHSQRIYRGMRDHEKGGAMIFKVREEYLSGIGWALRFIVVVRPRQSQREKADAEEERRQLLQQLRGRKSYVEQLRQQHPRPAEEAAKVGKSEKFEFYYSTDLLQHILVALSELGRNDAKVELCENLCKWITIKDGQTTSGMRELSFDLGRMSGEWLMQRRLPEDRQRELQARLDEASKRRRRKLEEKKLKGKSERLPWVWATKSITETEKSRAVTNIYRDGFRCITPDSVALERANQSAKIRTASVARDGGEWIQKALNPSERLYDLYSPHPCTNNLRREAKFSSFNDNRKNKESELRGAQRPTKTSKAKMNVRARPPLVPRTHNATNIVTSEMESARAAAEIIQNVDLDPVEPGWAVV